MTPVMLFAVTAGGRLWGVAALCLAPSDRGQVFGIAGPMATLSVNIVGSAMIGLLAGLLFDWGAG